MNLSMKGRFESVSSLFMEIMLHTSMFRFWWNLLIPDLSDTLSSSLRYWIHKIEWVIANFLTLNCLILLPPNQPENVHLADIPPICSYIFPSNLDYVLLNSGLGLWIPLSTRRIGVISCWMNHGLASDETILSPVFTSTSLISFSISRKLPEPMLFCNRRKCNRWGHHFIVWGIFTRLSV